MLSPTLQGKIPSPLAGLRGNALRPLLSAHISCRKSCSGVGTRTPPSLCVPRPTNRLILREALWSSAGS